jgi:hypothetical protein
LEKRLERNNSRIEALDAADLETIGEFVTTERTGEEGSFLDDCTSAFFPEPASAPDDAFPPPPWFMSAVIDVARSIQDAPLSPPFEFQPTEAAARANAETLAKAGYDLGKIIKEHSSSTLGYGSEFRPICQLKSVIGLHPNFVALADMIANGMSYIFHRAISEDEQQAETTASPPKLMRMWWPNCSPKTSSTASLSPCPYQPYLSFPTPASNRWVS